MQTDTFFQMFARQRLFSSRVLSSKNEDVSLLETKERLSKEYLFALMNEISEVAKTFNWKYHKNSRQDVNYPELKEELIDVFKYLLTLVIIWDIKPEEFIEEFYRKSAVVEQRFDSEQGTTSAQG